MNAILSGYHVSQSAWLYLSSLLMIAVFFRFRRVWSLRNFDLYLLLAISPGVLLVRSETGATLGYAWLFAVAGLAAARLLFDALFRQRPRVEPNLTVSGLMFLGISAFAFLMTEAITRPAPTSSVNSVLQGRRMLEAATGPTATAVDSQPTPPESTNPQELGSTPGPTASILAMPVMETSRQLFPRQGQEAAAFGIVEQTAARILAILAHIAIVLGLYWIGRIHFHDRGQGVAMATLYLLMPCTSYVVGEVNQVLPCAFLLWAFVCHERPFWAGVLMGCACGAMFFPVFVLPVWLSYFGWKQGKRFILGGTLVAGILLGAIALISADAYAFTQQTINRIDFRLLTFDGGPTETGFWTSLHPAYRLPVIVAFSLMVVSLTVWPWKKSLETLLAYTTAIIVCTQFWYPQLGGVYVLWYLPLLIVVIFRPRLQIRQEQAKPSAITAARLDQSSRYQTSPRRSGTLAVRFSR